MKAKSSAGAGKKVEPSALSHVDERGTVRMVDVGEKPETRRRAIAGAVVWIGKVAATAVRRNEVAKGNVLEIARIAGIQAAKRTHELIPLCHPLPLDHIGVECRLVRDEVRITAEASVFARTGVEMEAMTAASVAALTVYDMLKAVEKAIEIRSVSLREKRGGRSGTYVKGTSELSVKSRPKSPTRRKRG